MTDDPFIQSLCGDLTPVRARSVERQLLKATAAGAAVSFVALAFAFGIQPGLGTTAGLVPLVIKLSYTLAFAGVALSAATTLARPGRPIESVVKRLLLPVALLAGVAAVQLAGRPAGQVSSFMLGGSWNACPLRIVALSLPLMVALLWSLRRQAPVRLRVAGAMAGMTSGALAAAIYAFACSEASAGSVIVWYSLGIAAATAIGAGLGPRLLRW